MTQRPLNTRDIARLAGVSQATVSRVLQDHPAVSPDTRSRVRAALDQVGYRPNAAARALKMRRTGSVGVVVGRITNPLYPALLEIFGAEMAASALRMTVWDAGADGDAAALDALRQRSVDGVIFTTATSDSRPLAAALADGLPVVLVNRVLDGEPCPQVGGYNLGGGAAVAAYFARHGRRAPALIAGPRLPSTLRDRERGFREALGAAGLALPHSRVARVDAIGHDAGRDAMRRLLGRDDPPDAVFCVNDVLAMGAADACRALGVRVPADLWIVGYDDVEMAGWAAYDLTTLRQPLAAMAREALRLLRDRLAREEDGPPPGGWEQVRFANPLVVRGSTGHAPAGPGVVTAPGDTCDDIIPEGRNP